MNRRKALKVFSGGAGLAASMANTPAPLQAAQTAARRGMPPLKITDVKVIMTQPAGSNLVVVKVLTNEPGLYGVGCATHAERPFAVAAYLEKHLKPFVIGKNCDEIEDIWQSSYVQSYFRAGVTGNNALSGIDGALWDILGKRCNVPVYQLLGGKVRTAVPLYAHAASRELPDLEDQVRKYMAQGYRYVRVQLAVPGFSGYGVGGATTSEENQSKRPEGTPPPPVFEPHLYVTTTIKMFEYLRSKLGFDTELIHDIHERPFPNQSCQLIKAVEPYRPYFMEDPFAPEDVGWFRILRQQTTTAIAMGELFVNRNEWLPLVSERLIDFIRIHQSAAGGLNQCRKIAACCEFFNVRTAWHGPGNVDPIGHAYNLHLDLATYNFGIQEQTVFPAPAHEVFPGIPEIKGGYMYSNNRPGLGIDINEEAATKFPYQTSGASRGNDRRMDGTIVRP